MFEATATRRKPLSMALLLALCAGSIGCVTTTTHSRRMGLASAPPPGDYRILGVTTHDGMAMAFTEPAKLERDDAGQPVLNANVVHQNGNASRQVTIRVDEVSTFWIEYDERLETDDTRRVVGGLVGVVAAGAVLDALTGWH